MGIRSNVAGMYRLCNGLQRVVFWGVIAAFVAGVVILVVQWPNPSPGLLFTNGAILVFVFLNLLVRSRRGPK